MRAVSFFVLLIAAGFASTASAGANPPGSESGHCRSAIVPLQVVYRLIESGADYDSDGLLRGNATRSLVHALDVMESNTPDGEVGAIDFDVFTDSQDIRISQAHVEIVGASDDGACTLLATMLNYDEPVRMRFSMRLESGAWKIDEIAALDADDRPSWRLRELLATPADSAATSSTPP